MKFVDVVAEFGNHEFGSEVVERCEDEGVLGYMGVG